MNQETLYPKSAAPRLVGDGCSTRSTGAPGDESAADGQSAAAMLMRLGDDAVKWAAEFRKFAIRLGYSDMDEGWLIAWFANAIEHSSDVRRWRAEKVGEDAAALRITLASVQRERDEARVAIGEALPQLEQAQRELDSGRTRLREDPNYIPDEVTLDRARDDFEIVEHSVKFALSVLAPKAVTP